MKIIGLQGIMALLDDGNTIDIRQIKGAPRVGCVIEQVDGEWKVTNNNVDPDCVGGACPVK